MKRNFTAHNQNGKALAIALSVLAAGFVALPVSVELPGVGSGYSFSGT